MALGMWFTCQCRTQFRAYVPKNQFFSPITGTTVDWRAVDQREEADGEVVQVQDLAQTMGQIFVDLRQADPVQCPTCGEELDLWSRLHQRLFGAPVGRLSPTLSVKRSPEFRPQNSPLKSDVFKSVSGGALR